MDSDTSRDARELDVSRSGSLEGSASVSEHRRGSKARLVHSLSTRSFDRTLDGNTDREPPDRDLDLDWCPDCGVSLEQFDEETLNLCIVVLSTFVHQSPSMAMPFLLRMLECVARYVMNPITFGYHRSVSNNRRRIIFGNLSLIHRKASDCLQYIQVISRNLRVSFDDL